MTVGLLLPEEFYAHLLSLTSARRFLLGYSCGLDSHVLLHLLAKAAARELFSLRAIHIHHGLSPQADEWEKHSRRTCEDLQVPLVTEKIVVVKNNGDSLEAVARELRYAVFAKHLQPDECLLTAHTQTDQAETVLLQLLRGAGPQGLAAMPLTKEFFSGEHVRPLLPYRREQLQNYANSNKLQWVEDESNQNENFDRNFLRSRIFPLLKTRWPSVEQSFARSAKHCAQTAQEIAEKCEKLLPSLWDGKSPRLFLPALFSYRPALQCLLLRHWLRRFDVALPEKKLMVLRQQLLSARVDANPCVQWHQLSLRRYRDYLYLVRQNMTWNNEQSFLWDGKSRLELPGIGFIDEKLWSLHNIDRNQYSGIFTIRFRCGGERVKLPGQRHSQSLKKLFQQWGIPPWERDRVPFIYQGDKLVLVGYKL